MRRLVLFVTLAGLLVPATAHAGNLVPSGKNIVTCSTTPPGTWTTTSTTNTDIGACGFQVSTSGRALVLASATMSLQPPDTETRGQFRVGMDGAINGPGGFVNVAANGDDGTDRPVVVSAVLDVPAGAHAFRFAGRLESGSGTTVKLLQPTLAVVFVPDGSRARICGNDVNNFSTAASAFAPAVTCTATVAEQSTALVFGSGQAANSNGAYETRYGLRADGADISSATRWLDIDPSGAVGNYKHLGTAARVAVAPGTRTFSLTGSRVGGSGTAYFSFPSVAALILPDAWSRSATCGATNALFERNATSLAPLAQCSLTAPANGFGLVYGGGSEGIASGSSAYEARYYVAKDGTFQDGSARYVNAATGTGDGIDETVVAQWAGFLTAGAHTLGIEGQRFTGTGIVKVNNPTTVAAWFAPIDSTPPVLSVTGRPAAETSDPARFEFALNEPGRTTCALDGGAATPCASGQTYTGLALGDHTLTIAGADEVDNAAEPVTVTWKTLAPPPAPPAATPPTTTTPPVVGPPVVRTLAAPKVLGRSYDRKKGRLTLKIQVAGAGRLVAKATAPFRRRGRTRKVTVGSASRSATRAGTETVVLQLSRAARRAKRLKVGYVLTFTASGQPAQTVSGAVTIKR